MGLGGTSKILYPGGTDGKKLWIVRALRSLMKAPPVILHSTHRALISKMATGKSYSCSILVGKRRGVNPKRGPMESEGLKSMALEHFSSLRSVLFGLMMRPLTFFSAYW